MSGKDHNLEKSRTVSHSPPLAKTNKALQRKRDVLGVVMENTGAHLAYLDPDFNFIMVNSAYARGSGYTKDELTGRNHFDLFPDEENQAIFEQVRDTGKPVEFHDKPFIYRDQPWRGTTFWDWTLVPVKDADCRLQGMVLSLMDTTEHKRTEEALRQSEAHYRTLVEVSPDGIVSINAEGHIIDSNEGVHRLLGYTRDEIKGRDFRKLLNDVIKDKFSSCLADISEGKNVESELELIRRDSQLIPVWAKMAALYDVGGRLTKVVIYLQDISEHKKIEQMKDEFIGLVSHELRSPLTIITGAVNTALTEIDRLSPEETKQLLTDAALEAERLSHLLGNLLELSRVQADRLFLYTEEIDIKRVIQDTIAEIGRQYSTHRFILRLPENIPTVYADQLRLERIFYNLLENAVKYSPQGKEVQVSLRPDGRYLVIGVIDQGSGISKPDQDMLFGPFHRLAESRPGGVGGVGLGLLVCRRLVEAHDGRIWVESEPGKGAAFFFTLPLGNLSPGKRNPKT